MILGLYSKIIRKLHLTKRFKYLNILITYLSNLCSKKELTNDEVNSILNKYNPNINATTICSNQLETNPVMDLQIIVPAYNVEKYINKCIDSIIGQKTNYNIYIKIIIDGATDNTPHLLEQYRKYPNIEIISQENRGLPGARNRGLEYIKAKYIMFVDSDDTLPEGTIDKLLNKAINTNADIVEGSYNKLIDNKIECGNKVDINNKYPYGYIWGKIYKSELFQQIQFPDKYWYEDTIGGYIIYPKAKNIQFISDFVYNYRENPNSITHISKGKIKNLDSLYIMEVCLKDRKTLGLPLNQQLYEMTLYQIYMNYIRTYNLGNIIRRSVYYKHSEIIKTVFANFTTKECKFNNLELSLRNNDYNLYNYTLLFEI